jgi:hypothetical protein
MRPSRTLAIIAFMTAIAAPLAASAATTYNFTIPARLTGMAPGEYQFQCTVGPTTIPAPPGINLGIAFQIVGTSYSGTVTSSAQSSGAPAHSYTCVLYQVISPA